MPTQAEKAAAFRALHEAPGCFVIPNPWDVGSAKILAGMGYKALASTSSGMAWAMGLTDGQVTRDAVLEHCRMLSDATDLPLAADLEDCFAATPEGVAETIRLDSRRAITWVESKFRLFSPSDPSAGTQLHFPPPPTEASLAKIPRFSKTL